MKVYGIFLVCLFYNFQSNKCLFGERDETSKSSNADDTDRVDNILDTTANINRLLDRSRSMDALNRIRELSDTSMQHESIRLSYGRALIQTNQLKEGENIIKDVLKFNQSSLDAKLLLAKLYVNERRWDDAEKLLISILQQESQNSKGLALSSKILLIRDNNIQAARSLIERAVRNNPTDVLLQFELGMIRFFDEDHEAGKEAFETAEVLDNNSNNNNNSEEDNFHLVDSVMIGKIYLHYKHTDWAAAQFEKVLNRQQPVNQSTLIPPNTNVMLLLAECKDALGDHESALMLFEQILAIEPYNAVAHAGVGLILLGTSNHNYAATHACGLSQSEALSHLEFALQLQPDMKIVQEAVAFCQSEISEAKMWRKILSNTAVVENESGNDNNMEESQSTSTVQSSPSSLMNHIVSTIIRKFLSKPHQLILATQLFVQSLLSRFYHLFNIKKNENSANSCSGDISSTGKSVCINPSENSNTDNAQDINHAINKRKEIWKRRESAMPSVPRVEIHSQQEFQQLLLRHEPVIITNLQQNWCKIVVSDDTNTIATTITQENEEKNNSDSNSEITATPSSSLPSSLSSSSAFLKENLEKMFGAHVVRVSVSESSRFDGPEDAALWGLTQSKQTSSSPSASTSYDVLVRPPQTSMLFGDFLSLVSTNRRHSNTNNNKNNNKAEKWRQLRETFYIEYLALHQYFGVDFLNLIPLPDFIPVKSSGSNKINNTASSTSSSNGVQLEHLLTNIWIGGQPTTSPLHYDDYENLLSQIQGCKEIILFPPEDITYLYYISRPKATLKYKYPSTFIRDPTSIDKRGAAFVFGSSVNIDSPDVKHRHVLYTHATPIRAMLHAGDTLYLPAFWHHEVQSIPTTSDTSSSGSNGENHNDDEKREDEDLLNIAVNFWFANITAPPDSYVK